MKFPVLEMFCSIQGEGKWTGVPSIFVRLAGCNLRCVFGDSRCDTPYSSFDLEKPKWDTVDSAVKEFKRLINENPNVYHIVITGGEPLLHTKALKKFYEKIADNREMVLTIETNGTLPAIMPWDNDDECESWVDLWSVSPKLSTSVDWNCKYLNESQRDLHNKIRINYDNLASYIESMREARKLHNEHEYENNGITPYCQFKFVYSGEDSVNEIKEIIKVLKYEYNCDITDHIMLMPEGTTNDQLEKISQECAQVCIKEGWRFCDRLHIRIWGDKREV